MLEPAIREKITTIIYGYRMSGSDKLPPRLILS